MPSSRNSIRRSLWKTLVDSGYVVIPTQEGTKRPLLRWKRYLKTPPTREDMLHWFTHWPTAEPAILTGEASGLLCFDYDTGPFPATGVYTQTPSGGRHYWYPYDPNIRHGLGIRPGLDIPYLVKIYALPLPNLEIPEYPNQRITPPLDQRNHDNPGDIGTLTPADFNACAFIRWFDSYKQDSSWNGRYHLARAYASNLYFGTGTQPSLGPNYRHEQTIYASLLRPITCRTIVNAGFHCPHFDSDSNRCNQNPNVRSPYGLASLHNCS